VATPSTQNSSSDPVDSSSSCSSHALGGQATTLQRKPSLTGGSMRECRCLSSHARRRNDINSMVGAFAVGVIANVYGRIFRGNAFVVMVSIFLFAASRVRRSHVRADHGHPLPAAVRARERRAAHVRVGEHERERELGGRVPVRLPDRAAAHLGRDRPHRRPRARAHRRAPDPVAQARGGHLQPLGLPH
jgi:hypothetical protein